MTKYANRGFKPFLVDPQDNREKQNVLECDPNIWGEQFLPTHVSSYYSTNWEAREEIERIQEERLQNARLMFCCCPPIGEGYLGYTMKMFEKSEGDAVNFYKDRFNWSEEDLIAVNQIDPYLRVACKTCRVEYNLIRVIMARYPELMRE